MKINVRQIFALKTTGKQVKVTKVIRTGFGSTTDLCRVISVVNGKSIPSSARVILSDSIRRRYNKVTSN
jgi:hypothetical protein